MKFFDKLYARYDALCDKVEKLDLNPVKRAAVPAVFVFLALAAFLYAVGAYDFVFIERPESRPSVIQQESGGNNAKPDKNEAPVPDKPDNTDTPQVPANDGSPEPFVPESGPDRLDSVSDLCGEGYYITNTDYSPDTHKMALLNVELGANEAYSVRERNIYSPTYTYEYENGEAQVEYVLASEQRPSLEAYMGYLFADNGTSVIIFDSYGRYVTNYDESLFFAYTRDSAGTPLLYRPTSYTVTTEDGSLSAPVASKIYYKLTAGGVAASDYIDKVEGRGLHMDYPATYGMQTANISRQCILNQVTFLSLKGKLTGWDRTVWGFFEPGQELPFTDGWYDPEEYEAPDFEKMTEEEKEEWDEAEREAVKTRLNTAYNYSEGYAAVANEKGQMRFLDTAGKQIFESTDIDTYNAYGRRVVENLLLPLTDGIESLGFYYFDHGLVRVRRQLYDYYQLEDYDMKMIEYDDDELIYANGEKFTLAEGYDIISYSNGMILLEKNGKYGYMDYTGAWLIEPSLEGAKPFLEGLAAVEVGGKWGVIDTAGNTVIPFDYDSVQTVSSGVIVCHSDRGWTVFAKMTNQ